MVTVGVDEVQWGDAVYNAVAESSLRYSGYDSNGYYVHAVPRSRLEKGTYFQASIHSNSKACFPLLTPSTLTSVLGQVVARMYGTGE